MFKFKFRRKKDVYMSELFLEELQGDFSINSVLTALKKCNDELLKRLSKGDESEYLIDFLFGKDEPIPLHIEQEFSDFINVYGEFDNMIDSSVKKQFLILQ